MQANTIDLNDLFSVDEMAARHSRVLSVQTLRYQLRGRANTGLAACCVKVGKKLLISEGRYMHWLSTQTGA